MREPKIDRKAKKFVSSRTDLARETGLSRQTLWKYMQDPEFPAATNRGRWNVRKVLEFVLRQRRENDHVRGARDPDIIPLKRRRLELENESLEIRIARLRGLVLLRNEVDEEFLFVTEFFNSSLARLEDRLSVEVKDPKVIATVGRKVTELRHELADQLDAMAQRIATQGRGAAAAEAS